MVFETSTSQDQARGFPLPSRWTMGNEGAASGIENCPLNVTKEGPVLSMMSKRLRALKKKFNKILQIEESKLQGKVINREQEEVLKTKVAVATLIDEYEKLRQPLQAAVKEELAEREKELTATALCRDDGDEEETTVAEEKEAEVSLQKGADEVRKEPEMQDSAVCNSDTGEKMNGGARNAHDTSRGFHQQFVSSSVVDGNIAELLTFLYFAQLFDVRSHGEASSSVLWTKTHERSSCLSYDCVTEDETSPLLETDLDDLSYFGSLLTARPPNATLSHRDALQHCIAHAKLWLQKAEAPISEDLGLTYTHLRERLSRILSSEYFTMIPELQTVTEQTAAAAASATVQYASHLVIHKAGDGSPSDETTVLTPQDEQEPYETGEQYSTQPFSASPSLDAQGAQSETSSSEIASEAKLKVDSSASPGEDKQSMANGAEQDQAAVKSVDSSQQKLSQGQQGQRLHVPNTSVGPRGHQGPKGSGRGSNYGAGVMGRGYTNGRGARNGGGRAGYSNGRSGQYYDQGGYYPRGYNARGGGRSSRGGNATYNGYMNGQAARGSVNIPA